MPGEKAGQNPRGNLYIVATPIGNLEDLTLRALRILNNVSIIACEDTRQTQKLLNKYNIKKRLLSYYQPKESRKIPLIISIIKEGKDVALVTDSGTPGLSDPGFPLIREAIRQGITVVPVPGPSALTAAISASGLPTHRFLFLGFAPPKKEATRNMLRALKNEEATLVFFIPTRKLLPFLKAILAEMGNRQVVVAREMTKIHEEFIRGTIEEMVQKLEGRALKGEATVIVKGKN